MTGFRLEINLSDNDIENWVDVVLSDDASINVTEQSPLFNDTELYSDEISVPIEPNRSWIGSVADVHGGSIYELLYHKRFRLWVYGVIFRTGIIDIDDELEIEDEAIAINLVSGKKSVDKLLEGINAQDIKPRDYNGDPIVIGHCHAEDPGVDVDVSWQMVKAELSPYNIWNNNTIPENGDRAQENVRLHGQQILNMMFPFRVHNLVTQMYGVPFKVHGYNYTNTSAGYGNLQTFSEGESVAYRPAYYCNIPIVYQKYQQKSVDVNTGKQEWEKVQGYQDIGGEVTRPDSAPCFFALAWLDWLFQDIGINMVDNRLTSVKDMSRLVLVHLNCGFDIGDRVGVGLQHLAGTSSPYHGFLEYGLGWDLNTSKANVCLYMKQVKKQFSIVWEPTYKQWFDIQVEKMTVADPYEHYALANGKNFPDVEAKSLLESILSVVNAKLLYDDKNISARIVLIDDVLSQTDSEFIDLESYEVSKKENNTRGVRIKFSSSSKGNINSITGEEDLVSGGDDTTYNYNDFTRLHVMKHDSGLKDVEGTALKGSGYGKLINNIGPYDRSLYYDPRTGNAYRIKVDSDANTVAQLNPSLIEVAGYHDVELGDCSNDDFVEEITLDWNPLIPNDKNYAEEKKFWQFPSTGKNVLPDYCTFTDTEYHQGEYTFVKYDLPMTNLIDNKFLCALTEQQVEIVYNPMDAGWDISSNVSNPINETDMGVTFGILRLGNGDDPNGGIVYDHIEDEEGCSGFTDIGFTNGGHVTSDSVDCYGNIYPYNEGQQPISLKLEAEKYNPDYDPKLPDTELIQRKVLGGCYRVKVGGYGGYTYNKKLDVKRYVERLENSAPEDLIKSTFGTSNLDLFKKRSIKGINNELRNKGWGNELDNNELFCAPYWLLTIDLKTFNGQTKTYIYSPVAFDKNIAVVYSKDVMIQYFMYGMILNANANDVMFEDASRSQVLVGSYGGVDVTSNRTSRTEEYITFLNTLGKIYFDNDDKIHEVNVPSDMFGYGHNVKDIMHMSKFNQDDTHVDAENTAVAPYRGLYNRFYKVWAHWMLHRKIAVFTIPDGVFNFSVLNSIDFTKRYTIGNITGFINSIEYDVSQNGIGSVTIEMYYI